MASFALKKNKVQNGLIYLSQGVYNGRATWHYLMVDKLRLPILLKDVKGGEVELVDYGNILFSGFGEQPPEEVSAFVKKKYGTH